MQKEYELNVCLKNDWKSIFSENYKLALLQAFVENNTPKEHGFKNHVEWLVTQLKLNSTPLPKLTLKKREIYVVSYGMNTGSEINGDRPSIIYKDSNSTLWEDVIVIPLTSALRQKQTDKYDVFVGKDDSNKLFQNSFARLRQIRSVSLKKLGRKVGDITSQELKEAIDSTMEKMLGLDLIPVAV